MSRIAYDASDAEAFRAARHLSEEGLSGWRAAVAEHLPARSGLRLLDLGSGTGRWAQAFTAWFPGIEMVAVEPSAAMRELSVYRPVIPGDVEHLPLADNSVDAAWLSTVVHHLADVAGAARQLRRVVRGGGPVLIRSAFPGRHQAITLFRYFPEAIRVLDTYPTVQDVRSAFTAAGFTTVALRQVPQVTAGSLREAAAALRREAHTPLQLITDDEYAAGLARLHQAAVTTNGAVIDALDLLVLR